MENLKENIGKDVYIIYFDPDIKFTKKKIYYIGIDKWKIEDYDEEKSLYKIKTNKYVPYSFTISNFLGAMMKLEINKKNNLDFDFINEPPYGCIISFSFDKKEINKIYEELKSNYKKCYKDKAPVDKIYVFD